MNLAALIRRDARRLTHQGQMNTADVAVNWQAANAEYDPLLESSVPAATVHTVTYRNVLVHFVQPITSGVRQFVELKVGDVILDFLHDVDLPDRASFLVDGKTYVQKEVGEELAKYWDVIIGNRRMFRTVVLTLAR